MNSTLSASERKWFYVSLERLKQAAELEKQNVFETALEGVKKESAEYFLKTFLNGQIGTRQETY